MEASWGVQTASSAVRIIPSVFLPIGNTSSSCSSPAVIIVSGTVTGQRIVSTEVTNHHHVQLLPAGLDSSDVFIQVLIMVIKMVWWC